MAAAVYEHIRGADLVIPLEAPEPGADVSIVAVIDVGLKPARSVGEMPEESVQRAATFAVTLRAESGTGDKRVGPGWHCTLTAAQTAALAPGLYAMDAAVTLTGGVVKISVPLFVRLSQSVSR